MYCILKCKGDNMKKIIWLICVVSIFSTVILEASERKLNSGDHNIKSFEHRVYNNESWQYGTWVNDTTVDKVYGRMINEDYDTGDAQLLLQEKHVGIDSYFTACSKKYTNLEPGKQITCYNEEADNSGDTFRTNVKWTNINNSSSSTYYIDTQIEGGYNVE